jgi:hypothetical protein
VPALPALEDRAGRLTPASLAVVYVYAVVLVKTDDGGPGPTPNTPTGHRGISGTILAERVWHLKISQVFSQSSRKASRHFSVVLTWPADKTPD